MTHTIDQPADSAPPNAEYGRRDIAMAGRILCTVVGSGVHGIALAGMDDHDEMGIYIEPPDCVLGMQEPAPHYQHRTEPEGVRSQPGDVDLVMYSLRRYLRLVTKGSPTALLPLYAPAESVLFTTPLGDQLRQLTPAIVSQRTTIRFLKYLEDQRRGMLGHGKNVPNRPELVAKYGYDVKFASHALRLAYQAFELTRTGKLTLPMPPTERAHVRHVKSGGEPMTTVLNEIDRITASTRDLLAWGATPLPKEPELDVVNDWCLRAHREHWGWL